MEPLYELIKDIDMPGRYIRAGARKTAAEWKKMFPEISWKFGHREWFMGVPANNAPRQQPGRINEIINEVFDRHGLKSMSYKDACRKVVEQVLTEGIHLTVEPNPVNLPDWAKSDE